MPIRPFAAAVLALALTSVADPAVRAAKPAPDVPVVAVLADAASGATLRVGSDGVGAYAPGAQLQNIVQPRATGSDWLLTTYYTKRGQLTWTRGLQIDLSELETAGSFATPLTGPTVVPAHVKVGCSTFGVDMLSMTAGQAATCPGGIRFLAPPPNGRWYRLAFNSDNYPEVTPLTVTCMSGTSGCTAWTITPSGPPTGTDPNPKSRARLLEIDNSGNVLALGGTYFVSFSITLTR